MTDWKEWECDLLANERAAWGKKEASLARGIIFGLLCSAPFWAGVIWMWVK